LGTSIRYKIPSGCVSNLHAAKIRWRLYMAKHIAKW